MANDKPISFKYKNWLEKELKKKNKIELFAGIDNAFDVTYSLGNDINATGAVIIMQHQGEIIMEELL